MMPTCKECGQALLGDLQVGVDLDLNQVAVVQRISVQPRYAEIMFVLCRESPLPVAKDRLFHAIYGHGDWPADSNTLTVYIYNLRKHLANTGVKIEWISQKGYRLKRDF